MVSDDGAVDLRGRRVIVTGGTTGIGRAVAEMVAGRGARVLIFGRHEAELGEAVRALRGAGGEAHGLAADQSNVADVRRVFSEADALLGGVDVLVNNAGIDYGSLGEHDLEDVQYVVNTNLVGYIACAREAVSRMKGRGGHIVNVGSMSGDLREEENSVYVATKAAIQAFSESLRKTVNPDGLRVTLIEPGKVATEMVGMDDGRMEALIDEQKMLRPEDIADCVLYCLERPRRCEIVGVQIRPHLQLI